MQIKWIDTPKGANQIELKLRPEINNGWDPVKFIEKSGTEYTVELRKP